MEPESALLAAILRRLFRLSATLAWSFMAVLGATGAFGLIQPILMGIDVA
jgi:hypothetical protein